MYRHSYTILDYRRSAIMRFLQPDSMVCMSEGPFALQTFTVDNASNSFCIRLFKPFALPAQTGPVPEWNRRESFGRTYARVTHCTSASPFVAACPSFEKNERNLERCGELVDNLSLVVTKRHVSKLVDKL